MMALDDPDHRTEAALLAAYAAGDHSAARALIAAHAPRALNLARRMLRNEADAEEVAQEAMLRLWKTAPQWRAGEARISTWLYRVTANLCTDRLRRKSTAELTPEMEPVDDRPGAEAGLIAQDRAAALAAALDALPERQRLAVVLRHLEERGNPEIAEIMELSVEAVESLLARGRRALREALSGQWRELSYKETGI